MFGNTWRIGQVAGVEIKADASWSVIVLLIAYSMYFLFQQRYPDMGTVTTMVMAGVITVLFFSSVLIHELAHALTSIRRGIPVRGITLFLFGGATHAKLETRRPVDEFVIAVVGPLTSLVLAGVFWGVALLTSGIEAISGPIGYLAWINLVLAVFNLVPGFPLDGGRLLRSAVWQVTGSLTRATRIAARGGQVVGFLLIGVGVLLIFNGLFFDGLWLAAIGWFLNQAAWGSYRHLHVRRLLETVDAEDVMQPDLVTIPADIDLQRAVDEYFMRYDYNAFPVVRNGDTVGLLTLRTVRQVPRDEWPVRHVWHAMTPLEQAVTVPRRAAMDRVLEKLEDEETQRVLVTENGEVVGIITPRDMARWLRRSEELGLTETRS